MKELRTTLDLRSDLDYVLTILSNESKILHKFIQLRGYSSKNISQSYDDAKKPTGTSWTYLSEKDIEQWVQVNGWVGLVIPSEFILIDIDDKLLGKRIYDGLVQLGIKFIGIETPGGFQFFFKDIQKVKTQTSRTITVGGFLCDYRLPGKGYIVLPTLNTEGRRFIHIDTELAPMPKLFIPVRQSREEDEGKLLPIPISEGYRDDTLFRHASRLREWNIALWLNLTESDKQEILETINFIFCEPPLVDFEIQQKLRSANRYENTPDLDWPDPIPLTDYSNLPDFPMDALPEPGREIVKVVSEINQVDPGLTGSIYLSVLSACLSKKGEINLTTHREPLNIYTCQILDSGERKTSTMKILTLPIYEYQKERQDEMIDEVRDAQCELKIKEARLAKLQKQASSIDDPIERKKFEVDAFNLTKEIAENPVPITPTHVVDDITSEAMGDLMADNNERMALFSAEGGIFAIMAGRYNENGSNFDIYLKAHSGDPWSSHRVGRNAKSMLSPALSMCLAIQKDVIKEIGGNRQFRGRGLLARFEYSLCESQAGQRNRQNKGISESILRQYNEHIKALLDIPLNLHVFNLSPAAQETWDEFYNDIEIDMQPGKPLEVIKDWGSKLPGAVARIAGLLHYAKNGIDATNKPISVDIVNASCAIGAYYREHTLATFGLMQEDPRIEAAKRILEYINLHQPNTFKGRDVLRYKSAFKTMENVLPGLKVLIERGYIRVIEIKAQGIGRPEATSYEVNPKINMLEKRRQ